MLDAALVAAVVATTDLKRAREFYEGKLGLKTSAAPLPAEGAVLYTAGRGTMLLVYERATAGDSEATCADFHVDDFQETFARLRANGVVFEDYDMAGLKTVDGVVSMDGFITAWFKDPDGNILALSAGSL